jgi:hypothetical protein
MVDWLGMNIVQLLRILIVASILSLSALHAMAGEQDDVTYQALVGRVKGGDLSIDFRSLRLACIRSNLCEPRGTKADLALMNRAVADHEPRSVVEVAERLIEKGYVNMEAHATAVQAYTQLNESAKAKFHLDVTVALLRSIMSSGDGKSKESAFEVICDREEYYMLTTLGLPYLGSEVASAHVVQDGPHTYDRWEVRNPKTGQNVVVFFNTDQFSTTKSRVTDK